MTIDGTYDITVKTPMGKQNYQLELVTDGDSLSGRAISLTGKEKFSGGTVNGDNFEFLVKVKGPMGKMKLNFTGKASGDNISGHVKTIFGKSAFEGTRA